MNSACSFPKRERMVSQKLIDELFTGGKSQTTVAFPLRAVYLKKERLQDEEPVQVLFSVPKKRLHHAVERNRVKRQLRQCFRLRKQQLLQHLDSGQQLLVAFVWTDGTLHPTRRLEESMNRLFNRIIHTQ